MMQALVYSEDGQVQAEEAAMPQPESGYALVRVRLAGICRTDLEVSRGYSGYHGILGHEFVGEVVEVNQASLTQVEQARAATLLGQRVVGEINLACGTCGRCLAGMPTHCATRKVLGIRDHPGSLAEYLTLPLGNLHLVPEGVPDEAAVFTEPLAAACQPLTQVKIEPNTRVAVLGDGKLGLLVAQVLDLTGCYLYVVGKHAEKLAILKRQGILTYTLTEAAYLREMDVVVECSGRPTGLTLALQMLRPNGTLVLKSTFASEVTVDLSSVAVNEYKIVGSRCGPFAEALLLLKQGAIDTNSLRTACYPAAEMMTAWARAQEAASLKVLIDFR